jgi:hypothetical protein
MNRLYELPQATLQDAHKVLRAIADESEKGEYGKVQNGVVVLEDEHGNVHTFGLCGTEYYRAFAMLHLGIENLLTKRGREHML